MRAMLRFSYHRKVNIQQILFYLNLGIFVGCAYYLGNYYFQGAKSEARIDELRARMETGSFSTFQYAENKETKKSGKEVVVLDSASESKSMLEAYAMARETDYPYLVGRIKIEGTPIDYFVMQTPDDPEYFLDKDVTGAYNKEGTPFADVKCDLEKPTNNIMIYAHAMKNQHQFGSLRKYKSEEYYKEHPIIQFETMYEPMCDYEIVAAFYGTRYLEDDEDVFRYYYFFGTEDEREFDYFIDNVKELQCYDTGITPKFGDELITLSTCNNEKQDMEFGRFVVVARKVTNENRDEKKDSEEKKDEESEEAEDKSLSYDDLINSMHTDEPVPEEEAHPDETVEENAEETAEEVQEEAETTEEQTE
ncbi:MAG: class B sortase [Lachnospiraceae bacterium]|nr:class B sortase [Lachnospiraceae bacterium]